MPEQREPYLSATINKKVGKKKTTIKLELYKGNQWPRQPEGEGKIRMKIDRRWFPRDKMKFYTLSEVIEHIGDTFLPL